MKQPDKVKLEVAGRRLEKAESHWHDTCGKLTGYEAHIGRRPYKALHELQGPEAARPWRHRSPWMSRLLPCSRKIIRRAEMPFCETNPFYAGSVVIRTCKIAGLLT